MRYLTALLAACLSVASFAFDVPCLDPLACNFMEEGECFFTDANGDPCVIEGCTIEGACNFDPESNVNNGSCVYPGCDDVLACNYDEIAGCNDGSCDYTCCPGPGCCDAGTVWDYEISKCIPQNDCPSDLDGNGVIGVEDLLSLLSDFGTDCAPVEEPETTEFTCGDPVTYHGYNYATAQIGEQCWFAENLRTTVYDNGDIIQGGLTDEEWTSATSGATAIYGEGTSDCNNFSPDIDACDEEQSLAEYGRLYNWYAVIDDRGLCPTGWHVPAHEEWTQLEGYVISQGFEAFQQTTFTPYCNNPVSTDSCDFTFEMQDSWGDGWNGCSYDFLQNGQVIATETLPNGSLGVATITLANGVPCTIMVNSIGSYPYEVSWTLYDEEGIVIANIESQGSLEGTALKSTLGWNDNGSGTDNFGFSALPGGARSSNDGYFFSAGNIGRWWSSSLNSNYAWIWRLNYLYTDLLPSQYGFPNWGYSVRCLRDAE